MAEVKDKIVTVESLSTLHEHNKSNYMPMVNPTGSGAMTFNGDINATSITTSSITTSGNSEIGGSISANSLTTSSDASIGGDFTVAGNVTGDLKVSGNVIIENINEALYGVHPDTRKWYSMVHMNPYGNTVVGYGGYENGDSNTFVCGKDIEHYIASANVNYRPYYKAGDTINVHVRTSGYVTQMGTNVFFTIPLTKPIIGNPTISISSEKGFILRQGGKYTHGSDGSTTPEATYVKPTTYIIDSNLNSGIIVTAEFEDTTNVINNDSIGIYLDAKIKLT